MVKKVTGSSALVGYVGALETLPFFLFGPYAGVVADRMDRKWIMFWSDALSGICLGAFALLILATGKPPVWSMLIAPFALSSVRCFFMPAKSASIPALVPPEILLKANALSSGTQTVSSLVSLSLSAGILSLLYVLSPTWFYSSSIALNSASFLVSAGFIFLLPRLVPNRDRVVAAHPWVDFKAGLAYIRERHDLKILTVLLAIFRLTVAPFFIVYLAANDKWFGGKPQTIVWLEVFFTAGMLAATMVVGRLTVQRPLLWFANGLAVVGISVLAMAFSHVLWVFVLWQVVAGLAIPPADIPVATYLQLSVPDSFRGRINSVRDMVASGVVPIGMLFGGVLVERVGLEGAFVLMGLGMAGACSIGILDRRYRSARMPVEAV